MIKIRAYFKWSLATYEQALKFAKWIFRNMTCISGNKNRVKQINERHVNGVVFTIKDLTSMDIPMNYCPNCGRKLM